MFHVIRCELQLEVVLWPALEASFPFPSTVCGLKSPTPLICHPWLTVGCCLGPTLSVSLNFLALSLNSVWNSDDTNCPAWLPLTLSVCPLFLEKDPVPWEMNVRAADLLQRPFPPSLKSLRGQKKIDLNVSQSSAALTGIYNGPMVGAFYTFPSRQLQIDLILTSLGFVSSHCSQEW